MEVSARNSLKGTIKEIHPGAVNSEVTLEIVPGVEVTAIITKESVEHLQLQEGKQAIAVIKASDVIIATE
ncbi:MULTISPECIES: TOBE domain-containing protein [unclassified Nostoc]|uniref:TOBE domain-containing protein n=1 Tax=unclassified Nostoc TaxID=2593658 RepID=UPI000B95AAE6|nr:MULTISPECIES: molybdopterin-binding protein [unclassified Nostoc]MDZ8121352.1 molybdopterin-binding protein [Nostoc sp. CmiVER01]MDZ8228043.1 molybdopterin-binding protein [Nostoc sp. ChiVER01]OYD91637.1 transporter [Nostoc sp. 'Peltigera membranacea cyanobiont' 210A]QLE53466.1 transporter [Nostoc sp. C057]